MSDSQDQAEQLDDDVIGTDPVTSDEVGVDFDQDEAYALDERRFDDPMTDTLAGRDARTNPEQADLAAEAEEQFTRHELEETEGIVGDVSAESPEERALHIVEEYEQE